MKLKLTRGDVIRFECESKEKRKFFFCSDVETWNYHHHCVLDPNAIITHSHCITYHPNVSLQKQQLQK